MKGMSIVGRYDRRMRKIAAASAVLLLLALAGCAVNEPAAAPAPSSPASVPTPPPTVLDDPKLITTVNEGVEYVLAQPAGSMASDDIMNAALKLRPLAEDEFSESALGDISTRLLRVSLDGLDYQPDETAPELQTELTDIVKQLREIG